MGSTVSTFGAVTLVRRDLNAKRITRRIVFCRGRNGKWTIRAEELTADWGMQRKEFQPGTYKQAIAFYNDMLTSMVAVSSLTY